MENASCHQLSDEAATTAPTVGPGARLAALTRGARHGDGLDKTVRRRVGRGCRGLPGVPARRRERPKNQPSSPRSTAARSTINAAIRASTYRHATGHRPGSTNAVSILSGSLYRSVTTVESGNTRTSTGGPDAEIVNICS